MARLITPKLSLLRGGLSKIIGVYKWEERVIISVEHSVKDAVIDFYEVTYLYYFLNYYFTLFNHSGFRLGICGVPMHRHKNK